MRKIILFTFTALFLNQMASATVTLLDKETNAPISNGTVIQVWGGVDEALITWHHLAVVNNTLGTTKINMKRYTLNAPATVEDYFCWYVCLGSVVSSTTPELNHTSGACFNSNDTDTLTYFSAYYKPMGLTGSATFRYVFYDIAHSQDSAWIDITFNVTPLAVNEVSKEVQMTTYPNPANEIIHLNFENLDLNAKVSAEIYDVIGNKVMTQSITAANNRLDVSELANGAYICTVVSDRKSILTKRIVISH